MGVLQVGREEIVRLMGEGLTGSKIIGTDNTAFSDSQTGLLNELDREFGITATQTGDVMELVATFTNNTGAVTEAGIFTDDTDNTQISRQVVDAVNLESSDTLEVTFQLQVNDA